MDSKKKKNNTGTNPLLRKPTFETMEDGASVHVLPSGRPSQFLLSTYT